MNQLEILKKISPLPWETIRFISINGEYIGSKIPFNESATLTAINSTYGAGILPSEVAEMKELLECFIQGVDTGTSHSEQAIDLLTRINERGNDNK